MPENFEHRNALLNHLYATTEDPARWDEALHHFRQLLHARCCLLAAYSMGTGMADLIVHSGLTEPYRRTYERRFAGHGPWLRADDELLVSGAVVADRDVMPDETLRRTPFYLDWLRPQGLCHGVTAVLGCEGDWISYAQCFRRESDGPFRHDDLETCRWVAGHLGRLLRLRRCVLEALHRGGGVPLRTATRSLAAAVLADARVAPRSASLDPDPLAAAIRLIRRPGDARRAVTSSRADDAGARAEALRRRFGLTPAEARVALLLGRGRSVGEIAAALGVATTTVRTHLRQIFAKTNTHRQSELLMLLLGAEAAPLAANG